MNWQYITNRTEKLIVYQP